MKKFIYSIVLMFALFAISETQAQVLTAATTVGGTKKVDTTDNTETNYLVFKTTTDLTHVAMQVVATKISGTPNGCLTFEVSQDGTNYTTLSAADTLHVSNVSTAQTRLLTIDPLPYLYVRIKSVGRGTASYKVQLYYYPKKN